MERTVMYTDRNGFTLIELMIATLFFSVIALGLVATAILAKKEDLKTVMRNEAVKITANELEIMRSEPFDSIIDSCAGSICDPDTLPDSCIEQAKIRNATVNFGKLIDVSSGPNPEIKNVDITVCWKTRNRIYTYSYNTVLTKE